MRLILVFVLCSFFIQPAFSADVMTPAEKMKLLETDIQRSFDESIKKREKRYLPEDDTIAAYTKACIGKIRDFANYPSGARGKYHGSVGIAFDVLATGALGGVTIERSSGYQILDAAAMQAVRNASPFSAFSSRITQQTDILRISTTLHYIASEHED
jgi:TonB family protein